MPVAPRLRVAGLFVATIAVGACSASPGGPTSGGDAASRDARSDGAQLGAPDAGRARESGAAGDAARDATGDAAVPDAAADHAAGDSAGAGADASRDSATLADASDAARSLDAMPPLSVSVADQLNAGYSANVSLHATASGAGTLTYAWTQAGGPAATLTGAASDTLSFTTQDLATSLGPVALDNARFDALGINRDQALDYTFRVVVTDSLGRSSTATATVNATRPTSGLRMVPVGVPCWLQGNGPLFPIPASPPGPGGLVQTSWSWALDTTGAPGSHASLTNPTSQFPSFIPDVVGTYAVTDSVSKQTMSLYAGTWAGEMTGAAAAACGVCHGSGAAPDLFPPWEATAHHSALQRELDGVDGQSFRQPCLACHVVGWDPFATNGGFDDVLATAGWAFPSTLATGNWSALLAVPRLGQLAGIQCESCHGPQNGGVNGPHDTVSNVDTASRDSWSSAPCATCHQESPSYSTVSQWTASAHADLSLAVTAGSVEQSPNAPHCGRCHSAQGFARYVSGLSHGYYAFLTSDGLPLGAANTVATSSELTLVGLGKATVQPATCVACHDPHGTANPDDLRIYGGASALPSGLTGLTGMGAGMVCAACHTSYSGAHTDLAGQVPNAYGILPDAGLPDGGAPPALTGFAGPHGSAQTDVLLGSNAYFVGGAASPSPHLAVADTCVGCHYAIPSAAEHDAGATTNHTFAVDGTTSCATCHGTTQDGAALASTVQGQLTQLRGLFASKTLASIAAALNAAPGATLVARAYDPTTGFYSSASATALNVVIASVPTSVAYTPIVPPLATPFGPTAQTVGLTLGLQQAVMVQWVDGSGAPFGPPASVTTLTVPLAALKLPPPGSGTQLTPFTAPTANSLNVQVLYKAYWNLALLNVDNTFGVHNPAFYTSVIQATTARLHALP